MEAEGVLEDTVGRTKAGMVGRGRSSSVYTSSRISESPTIAAGWSAK